LAKLATEKRHLTRSPTYKLGGYFELWVSPWSHVHCTCAGFTYWGICKHAEALRGKLNGSA
jgi:hypothetical protein